MPWQGTQWFEYTEASVLANAPEESGVYALTRQYWIYIGESADIRASLLQHLRYEKNACVRRAAPNRFSYELVAGEAARLARQDKLIWILRPRCGKTETTNPHPR